MRRLTLLLTFFLSLPAPACEPGAMPYAGRVLVVGDSLAEGIVQYVAREWNPEMINGARHTRGLARFGYFDTLASFQRDIAAHALQPGEIVVIWLGTNDGQFIDDVNKISLAQLSEAETWRAIYADRVRAMAQTCVDHDLTCYWLTTTASGYSNHTAYMQNIANIFREELANFPPANLQLIDVWDLRNQYQLRNNKTHPSRAGYLEAGNRLRDRILETQSLCVD